MVPTIERQLSVAVVGLGGLGRVICRSIDPLDAVVCAGVDVSPEARRTFEQTFDTPTYRDIAALIAARDRGDVQVDAVVISTPHTLHYDQSVDCLRAGLHVLVEKPMVTDVRDAVHLVTIADERDLVLQVGYQRHFHPAFTEIARAVDDGWLGDVHSINAHLGQDWIVPHRDTWRTDVSLSGGGQLYDSGSHLLDSLLWMTGTRPRRIGAQMAYDSPGIDVTAALTIELERAAYGDADRCLVDDRAIIASIMVSGDGVVGEPHEHYTMWGTDGRLTFDGETIRIVSDGEVAYEATVTDDTAFMTLTERKIENFIAAIRGAEPSMVPGSVGVEITALTEAAYVAATEGRTVDVRSTIDAARERVADTQSLP